LKLQKLMGVNVKKIVLALAIALFAAGSITAAFAHSGGTDRNGCHHDRKNGGYHCH
jgi:hypothetical protein